MARKIAAGMQDIDDDDLIWPIQKHQEMLPCPEKPQIFGPIHKNSAAPAGRPALNDRIVSGGQLRFIEFGLTGPKFLNRPSGDLDQAGFCATRQPEGPAHYDARAFAKARRTASSPLPSARSPVLA